MFPRPSLRIGIIGGGVAGLASAGHLVNQLAAAGLPRVRHTTLTLFQPPRAVDQATLGPDAQRRWALLQARGLNPAALIGGGSVYDPLAPSLFTFNGDSTATGFDFANGRFDDQDYFDWLRQNRDWIAELYPDFAPECGRQRHPGHTLDAITGTSPRGAYGLYLHEKFCALQRFASATHGISLTVMPTAVSRFEMGAHETVSVLTADGQTCRMDSLICATGNLYQPVPIAWAATGRVFVAYPAQGYAAAVRNAPQLAVVGAGPAGIETALHALHDLNVGHVTLVSRTGCARLPEVSPTLAYTPQFFTRAAFAAEPTAAWAARLLRAELAACYQVCGVPDPGWEKLVRIADYPAFLRAYLATTDRNPNHPLALLMRPVRSFYSQVRDLVAESEQNRLRAFLDSTNHLFATQSRPSAELLLAAIDAGRLTLVAGTLRDAGGMPVIALRAGGELRPECLVLATGFGQTPPPVYAPALGAGVLLEDRHDATGLRRDRATGRLHSRDGRPLPLFAVGGSALGMINRAALAAATACAADARQSLHPLEEICLHSGEGKTDLLLTTILQQVEGDKALEA
jgi:hypothetical protein